MRRRMPLEVPHAALVATQLHQPIGERALQAAVGNVPQFHLKCDYWECSHKKVSFVNYTVLQQVFISVVNQFIMNTPA